MTKTELKENITKINKLLRSDSYEAGIELIKTLDDPDITIGTLKAVIARIKKFLKQRDYEAIDTGIELARSLDEPAVFETLLEGCSIDEWGSLSGNKIFSGSKPAQKYLYYGLLSLIMCVPHDCKINKSLKKENVVKFSIPSNSSEKIIAWKFILECKNLTQLYFHEVRLYLSSQYIMFGQIYFNQSWNTTIPNWLIDQVINKNNPKLFEIFLKDITMDEGGKLLLNGHHSPLDESNLDFVMLSLIAQAPKNVVLDKSIKSENIVKLNLSSQSTRRYAYDPVHNTLISSLGPTFSKVLNSFPNLKLLNLHHFDMDNLDELKDCKNISDLDLSCCGKLQNVNGLAGNKKIRYLKLHAFRKMGITSNSVLKRNQLPVGLDKIQNLSSLDLSDNGYLTDIGLLSKCLHLTSLDLSSCSLQNVDVLANLPNLTSLNLRYCASLQNVDVLANLTNLTSLDLRECNSLQNVDVLANLPNLTTLGLCWCKSLKNVDGLANLPNLTSLNLEYSNEVHPKPSKEEMTTREEVAAYQEEIRKSMK